MDRSRHGFIDRRGNWVFSLDGNAEPEEFEDGLATVRVSEPPLAVHPEVRDVFCDAQTGEVIVGFEASG